MKTVLIVYAVSSIVVISIYIAIYISSKVQKKAVDYSSSKLVLNIVFAPFVLLYIILGVVPFVVISDTKRKIHKVISKIKKRAAIYKYKSAVKEFTITPQFIETAEELQRLAICNEHSNIFDDDCKCDDMMACLDKLSLPDLSFLCVRRCLNVGSGDRSHLYISKEGSNDYSIWDHITVEDSHMGAWQTYLLYSVWHYLPFFWHGAYNKRSYIYTENDVTKVSHFREEVPNILKDIKRHNFSPRICGDGSNYYVSCCFWSNWGGLIKEVAEIVMNNNKVTSISIIGRKVLIPYECGIMF